MHYNLKNILLAVSIMAVLIVSVLGQTIPASGILEKRNFDYLTNQHLTARLGNNKVCGDHMCTAGEWSKLQENLNKAQIGHGSQTNLAQSTPLPTKTNSTSPITSTQVNSTSSSASASTPPVPTPIPTPPATQYYVCKAVKETLANSTVSSDVVTKIMADLSCS